MNETYIPIKILKDGDGIEYAVPLKHVKDFRGDFSYYLKHNELDKFYEKYNPYLKEGLSLYIKQ